MSSTLVSRELDKYRRPNSSINNHQLYRMGATGRVVKTSIVRRIAAAQFKVVKNNPINEIYTECEHMLDTGREEELAVAFDWAYRCRKQYRPQDFVRFERWLKRYVNGWGSCDDLCCHTLGWHLVCFPGKVRRVVAWTGSRNQWVRRASAVSVIPSLRSGQQLDLAFEIADRLLYDSEDLVQKGYGWMLKEASNRFPDEVFRFVLERKDRMPRTALRYAIEKLPDKLRKQAMKRG